MSDPLEGPVFADPLGQFSRCKNEIGTRNVFFSRVEWLGLSISRQFERREKKEREEPSIRPCVKFYFLYRCLENLFDLSPICGIVVD